MPEGPSIVILRDSIIQFKGKKIISASGNATFDKSILVNKKIIDFKSWGKQFFIVVKNANVRIHFLLFGSYSINEKTKPEKQVRLELHFASGSIYFYSCAIRLIEGDLDDSYDWSSDVMNEGWDPKAARKKLKNIPSEIVCDVLLNQEIFSGVGNIIKNEVLYRIKLHPETHIGDLSPKKLSELIKEARKYSFDFLEWKKAFVLKKNWLAHTKRTCKRCEIPLVKKYPGKTKRRTFFCKKCQVRY
ncbi:MAG: DNA-formamidopyrimidine glycosylase family protein [Ferruginibacter sp.]